MTTVTTQQSQAVATPVGSGQQGIWLEIVTSKESLETYLDAWNDLAANALDANLFYEPAMLLPALTHVAAGHDVVIVLMFRSVQGQEAPELVALFPLERTSRHLGLPLKKMKLWEYDYCYLTTPLIRKGCGRESWIALFDWMKADSQAGAILEQRFFPGEGPVYQELVELVRRRGLLTFEIERATRSYFRRRTTADSYLEQSLSPSKRRDLNRKWRRLEELGAVDIRTLNNADDLPKWIDDFLRIEKSGWKGDGGTAIGCKPHGHAYFSDMCTRLFEEGRLNMIGLFLNDEPIAIRCSFLAAPGAFFFKPAYNEEYSKYSPGVHLEVELIRQLHDHSAVNWMDSCTSPDNVLLNKMWLDRRCVLEFQVATKGMVAPFLLGAVQPALRWINRSLGRYRTIPD
ncbi:MAG: GNAT family N-acetyltransferase [Planctomycetaceae bacterium]|nr:GNAT family N-acetyltransferase [Planctomycetaceae bacterium]MCA9046460.1 GNAT family N-acetyltransferase [Planctomycetaceae bacterium]